MLFPERLYLIAVKVTAVVVILTLDRNNLHPARKIA